MRLDLSALREFLFPYRAHLEGEIEYLRAQLAQQQRRVDELQESLIAASAAPVRSPRTAPAPAPPVRPRGWEKWRTSLIADQEQEEKSTGEKSGV